MKTKYSKGQIEEAISFWKSQLLAEALEPKTEAKLKDAAKAFAKAIGNMIKAGGMFRFEDGETPDPLVAIKTTVKKGVSADNCKKELKKLGTPPELIDQMAKSYADWFSKNIFGGDKKAIDNLLKTTEQFNYFANVVFGVWHRDPVLSKLLKKTTPAGEEAAAEDNAAENVEEGESFRANGNEDAAIDEADGDAGEDASTEEDLDEEDIDERYDRFGGYGGYGRKYSSYGSSAPRGEAIGWYCVADVDPACKSMDRNWRFGPIEFTRGVVDFLYPERQYKRGATMLRNKHVKMPDSGESVEVYVGIPSIFDAVKNNDEEALKKLEMIGINKNISLGLDPDDDYTAQYVLR